MNVENMRVEVKDGLLRTGNDVHILEDASQSHFKTESMQAFLAYVGLAEGLQLFFDATSCTAMPVAVNRNTIPVASLTLSPSRSLEALLSRIGKKMKLEEFEEFLRALKQHLDFEGFHTLSHVRDFRISKITKVERKKDRSGNYSYTMTREAGGGKDDFAPPEQIVFHLPVFKHLTDEIELRFDLSMDYQDVGDTVALSFQLMSYTYEDELQNRRQEVIEGHLQELPVKRFWGNLGVVKADDSWRYKHNVMGH